MQNIINKLKNELGRIKQLRDFAKRRIKEDNTAYRCNRCFNNFEHYDGQIECLEKIMKFIQGGVK